MTEQVTRFVNFYLGSDGVLVLVLVAQHSDVVFSSELIATLWQSFVQFEAMRVSVL